MMPVRRIVGVGVPFDEPNVDTDQIVPGRFLLKPRAFDHGKLLFHDRRFGPHAEAGFILDDPAYRRARILVGAENFGCGSSREQAPWALADFGIRAVVAPSFGDIFRINCVKNGLVPAEITTADAVALRAGLHAAKGAMLTVDLERQSIEAPGGHEYGFSIDPALRDQLLSGEDDVMRTLRHETVIAGFEQRVRTLASWTLPRADDA